MSDLPELDPNIVTTLIEKIVEDITDEEIDTLIAFFRKERQAVIVAEAAGRPPRARFTCYNPVALSGRG